MIDNQSDSGPVVVGVDGSERSIETLALADLLGPALLPDSSPAAGLHAFAEREQTALIVVGSSHRSRIGRIVVGGTGERLLSGASAPVAVAPAGYAAAGRGLQVVGCGFDGSPESHRALAWAAELARTTSARPRVLSVYEPTLATSVAFGPGLPTASSRRWWSFRAARRSESGFQGTTRPRRMA